MPAPKAHKLDDVMLAMDVVDTLRHRQQLLDQDLRANERREDLIARLRHIYEGQGIEVSDAVLMEGVKALEEHRFTYTPKGSGFARKLAGAYVARRKWLPGIVALFTLLGLGWGFNHAVFVAPKAKAEAERVMLLEQTLPSRLEAAYAKVKDIAKTPEITAKGDALLGAAQLDLKNENASAATANIKALETMAQDLAVSYTIRIVSRPGEYSGVFRLHDDSDEVKNYYLIVEALDAAGNTLSVNITSEEDQATRRTKIWGVRVPETVFQSVAADKRDDQIIQDAVIGQKPVGVIEPDFEVDTLGGYILEW